MIQANELRIGNLLRWKDQTIRVDNLVNNDGWHLSDGINGSYVKLDEITPIPLTEEILLKSGFKEGGNTGYNEHDWYNRKRYSFEGFELIMFYGTDVFWFEYNRYRINTIHQLQNIFFYLTGKELNVEL